MSEARIEAIFPPETVVAAIAGLLAVAHVATGTFYEPESVAAKAWDIWDAVFVEADERYKETGDGQAEGGGEGDTRSGEGRSGD